MESALMMTPPSFSASSSAKADLPLAVGPAMRMILDTRLGSHDMSYVATLISAPQRPVVTETLAARVAEKLPQQARVGTWLHPGVAIDIVFDGPPDKPGITAG